MIQRALLQELGNGRLEPEIKSLAAGLARRNVPYSFFVEKQLQRRRLSLDPSVLVAGHIPVVLGALRQSEPLKLYCRASGNMQMTLTALETRVAALEQKLEKLAGQVGASEDMNGWIDQIHGTFQDDAAYRQAARLGR